MLSTHKRGRNQNPARRAGGGQGEVGVGGDPVDLQASPPSRSVTARLMPALAGVAPKPTLGGSEIGTTPSRDDSAESAQASPAPALRPSNPASGNYLKQALPSASEDGRTRRDLLRHCLSREGTGGHPVSSVGKGLWLLLHRVVTRELG